MHCHAIHDSEGRGLGRLPGQHREAQTKSIASTIPVGQAGPIAASAMGRWLPARWCPVQIGSGAVRVGKLACRLCLQYSTVCTEHLLWYPIPALGNRANGSLALREGGKQKERKKACAVLACAMWDSSGRNRKGMSQTVRYSYRMRKLVETPGTKASSGLVSCAERVRDPSTSTGLLLVTSTPGRSRRGCRVGRQERPSTTPRHDTTRHGRRESCQATGSLAGQWAGGAARETPRPHAAASWVGHAHGCAPATDRVGDLFR